MGAGSAAVAAGGPSARGWGLPLLTVVIGSFMTILDSTIVNVAVPTLMAQFGASTDQVEWVVTIFLLVLGVVVPISGWLADRYGLGRIYIIALVIFTAGSALCGLSTSLGELVFFRLLQGIGGGLIAPITLAMVYRLVPREKIGLAMGIYGLTVAFGPALGPTLGGYLVEYVDWRLIFYINVPVGILGLALATSILPPFPTDPSRRFDLWGFVTSAVGLSMLLLGLSEGQTWGWTSEITVLVLMLAVWALVLFVVIELQVPVPLLDLRIFRYGVFTLSSVLIMVSVVALYAGSFYVPLFMQTVQGLGAFPTGMALMPGALCMGAAMPLAGRLYDRIGARIPAVVGLVVLTVATVLMTRMTVLTPVSTIMWWMALRYAGLGLAFMPIMTAGLAVVPTNEISRASAINNIIQRTSAALGLAVLTEVFSQRSMQRAANLANSITYFNHSLVAAERAAGGSVGQTMQSGVYGQVAHYGGLLALAPVIEDRAFAGGVHDVFVYAALASLVAIPLAFLLRGGRRRGGERTVVAAD
jgi:EmrB/QacA subfamily drug resistance transporter